MEENNTNQKRKEESLILVNYYKEFVAMLWTRETSLIL